MSLKTKLILSIIAVIIITGTGLFIKNIKHKQKNIENEKIKTEYLYKFNSYNPYESNNSDYGKHLNYSISHNNILQVIQPDGKELNGALLAKGFWNITVLKPYKNFKRIQAKLDLKDLKVPPIGAYQDTGLGTSLQKPFQIIMDNKGIFKGFYFEHNISTDARNTLRFIALQFQFSMPNNISENKWYSEEPDTVGIYSARYSYNEQNNIIHKTKIDYKTYANLQEKWMISGEKTSRKINFEANFILNKNGWCKKVDVKANDNRKGNKNYPTINTNTNSSLNLISENKRIDIANNAKTINQLKYVGIWDIEALNKDATEYHKNWDRERVGNNNLEDLIELSKQSKNQKDPAAHRIEIFDKLKALCRLEPKTIDDIKNMLINDEIDSKISNLLTSVLGSLNNIKAHETLLEVIESFYSSKDYRARDSIVSLVLSPLTSEKAIKLMQKINDRTPGSDAAISSVLGIGAHSRKIINSNKLAAKESLDYLKDSYSKREMKVDKIVALKALGNNGDESILPILKKELNHRDFEIRQAVINSLRYLNAPLVNELIKEAMLHDEHHLVRRAAVKICNVRDFKPMIESIGKVVYSDPHPKVRAMAMQIIVSKIDKFSELVVFLEHMAYNDQSETLRQDALRSINAYNRWKANPEDGWNPYP